jgi:sugar O-acyltransferase (sialic acid O-acetyltransferase NeuD family)
LDLQTMESVIPESAAPDPTEERDLIVVGAGGAASEALWLAESVNLAALAAGRRAPWRILGCCVYDPSLYPAEVLSYRVLGRARDVARDYGTPALHYTCAIGDNRIREREASAAGALGWKPATLIHPSCQIASNALIGPGTSIAAFAVLGPHVKIGAHVMINTHVSIGHESTMGDFSQACPGARVTGKCSVGRSALLGSNATMIPATSLGDRSVLGANSVAVCSFGPDLSAFGIPARARP